MSNESLKSRLNVLFYSRKSFHTADSLHPTHTLEHARKISNLDRSAAIPSYLKSLTAPAVSDEIASHQVTGRVSTVERYLVSKLDRNVSVLDTREATLESQLR